MNRLVDECGEEYVKRKKRYCEREYVFTWTTNYTVTQENYRGLRIGKNRPNPSTTETERKLKKAKPTEQQNVAGTSKDAPGEYGEEEPREQSSPANSEKLEESGRKKRVNVNSLSWTPPRAIYMRNYCAKRRWKKHNDEKTKDNLKKDQSKKKGHDEPKPSTSKQNNEATAQSKKKTCHEGCSPSVMKAKFEVESRKYRIGKNHPINKYQWTQYPLILCHNCGKYRVDFGSPQMSFVYGPMKRTKRGTKKEKKEEDLPTDNECNKELLTDDGYKEAMATENEQKDEMAAENEQKEKMATDNEQKEGITTENEQEEEMATDNEQKEEMTTDNEQKEEMTTDNEQKEEMTTDNEQKEEMTTDNEQKEEMTTDNEQKEEMATDNEQKEKMATDSGQKEKMTTGNEQEEKLLADREQEEELLTDNEHMKENDN